MERSGPGLQTTPAQREALIAAYERLGKVRPAMREAGIRSPRTAYLWLRRHRTGGPDPLAHRSRCAAASSSGTA